VSEAVRSAVNPQRLISTHRPNRYQVVNGRFQPIARNVLLSYLRAILLKPARLQKNGPPSVCCTIRRQN
jgi:hypothetical protein